MVDQFYTGALAHTAGLAGGDKFPYDDPAGGSNYATATDIANFSTAAAVAAVLAAFGFVLNLPNGQYSTDTSTADFTVAAGKVAGSRLCVLDLTGTLAAPHNIQMPTAVALVAQVPNAVAGETYVLRIINDSVGAFAWTVTGNTGLTVNGTASILNATWREFLVTLTSLTVVVLQEIGGGVA